MKRTFPFHPVVIAAYPVLALFGVNASSIPLGDLWRPLGIAVAVGVVLLLLGAGIFRSWERGAFVATLVAIALWIIQPLESQFTLLGLGTAALCASVPVLAILIATRKSAPPTRFLNLAGVVLAVLTLGQIALAYSSRIARLPIPIASSSHDRAKAEPNVYYIILDGYGRSDTVKRTVGLDNSEFISGLKSRGFYVADKSRSNYCQTAISLGSSLNFTMIPDLVGKLDPQSSDRELLYELVQDDEALKIYSKAGYSTAAITTGFQGLDHYKCDLPYPGPQIYSVFETAVLNKTPLANSDRVVGSMFDARRRTLQAAFDNMVTLATRAVKPRFIIAHVLAPHPPFVFGPNGEPRRNGPFGFWDGSDYMEFVGTPKSYAKGYRDQATYLGKMVLAMVDKVVAASPTPPVIILQGDHGSKHNLSQNSLEKTDLQECFSNLTAVYGPQDLQKQMYPTITPVNLLRIATNYVTGSKLPAKPDRSYFSPFSFPYRFTDVTDRLDKIEGR
jgi:hypothetical protein